MWGDRSPAPRFPPDSGVDRAYPGASSLASACVQNLTFLTAAFDRLATNLVREAGVPSVQALAALTLLQTAAEPLPPSTLAERMGLTRATVTGIVDSLERHGLARRRLSGSDGRMRLVEVTPEGNLRLMRLVPRLRRAEASWLAALSEAQQRELLELVATIEAGLPGNESDARR